MRRITIALVLSCVAAGGMASASRQFTPLGGHLVRVVRIAYRAHDGLARRAYVLLPRWYGPQDHPPIPLVISPHGRGVPARENVRLWGNLPAQGRFAVVNPEGQGRRLALYSWGDPGQIRDLARMPEILRQRLAWLRIDQRRIYAFGGSMGGQEVLLLGARFPRLLAGAAAFDAPTDLAARYRAFRRLRDGRRLQRLARYEIGGDPWRVPRAYATRSPIGEVRRLASSGVPLQIWWSRRDRIVADGLAQSGLLVRELRGLSPSVPVQEFVGAWRHSADMRPDGRLPDALRRFGLLPGARASSRQDDARPRTALGEDGRSLVGRRGRCAPAR